MAAVGISLKIIYNFLPAEGRRLNLFIGSGGTIRRELDCQTRVCVLASTSIPIGNVGDEKKKTKPWKIF